MVEHNLAKVGVASSSLVFRSTHSDNRKIIAFFCAFRGRVRDHIDNPSKPPFDKGGFAWSRKRDSDKATPHTPFRGWGCKYSSREIAPRSVGSSLVFRSTHSDNRKIIAFFCAFRGRVRDHIDNPTKPPFKFTSLLFVATARKNKFICSSLALIATLIRETIN